MSCPLCGAENSAPFHEDRHRPYFRCTACALVYVPKAFFLSTEDERAVYDLHENDPNDAGYRRFLSRMTDPLLERIPKGASGLDFGCGPGPTLSVMLEEAGCRMTLFDPFYAVDEKVLSGTYDFITLTEVIEHLHAPERELSRLCTLLAPRGILGIMTKLVKDRDAFSSWHYIRDPTHVAFYSKETFLWIASRFGLAVTFHGRDVILLEKPITETE